tara:strand:- start:211 stop:333 length:123 start_codon:yes stop_codon:yes gene_type:complete
MTELKIGDKITIGKFKFEVINGNIRDITGLGLIPTLKRVG